jgi:hypothetical protein
MRHLLELPVTQHRVEVLSGRPGSPGSRAVVEYAQDDKSIAACGLLNSPSHAVDAWSQVDRRL